MAAMKNLLLFVAFVACAFVGRLGVEFLLLWTEGTSTLWHFSPWTLLVVCVTATVGYLFAYGVFRRSSAITTGLICGGIAVGMFMPYLVAMRFSDWQMPTIVFAEWLGIGLLAHVGRNAVSNVYDAAQRALRTPVRRLSSTRSRQYVLD
jgi:hypothetical protein